MKLDTVLASLRATLLLLALVACNSTGLETDLLDLEGSWSITVSECTGGLPGATKPLRVEQEGSRIALVFGQGEHAVAIEGSLRGRVLSARGDAMFGETRMVESYTATVGRDGELRGVLEDFDTVTRETFYCWFHMVRL